MVAIEVRSKAGGFMVAIKVQRPVGSWWPLKFGARPVEQILLVFP
jgi:hypothetical protein